MMIYRMTGDEWLTFIFSYKEAEEVYISFYRDANPDMLYDYYQYHSMFL